LKNSRIKIWSLSVSLLNVQSVLISSLFVLILASMAWGGDYKVRRTLEGHTLDITLNRNPPVMGKNIIRIEIKDARGQSVINNLVTVNYYMPPMPGMPPMNYTLKAIPSGSGYMATMDFIMTGPWNIVVKTTVAGKQLRLTVPIDVR
jgi:hypothetical protein